jgi:hypothetical protein
VTRLSYGKCDDGWICERHPDLPWPLDQCPGPAMPCDVAACPYRIEPRPVKKTTGFAVYGAGPVADIENEGAGTIIFQCPQCGNRWSTENAATRLH